MNYNFIFNVLVRINEPVCSMKAVSILMNQTWYFKGFHQ